MMQNDINQDKESSQNEKTDKNKISIIISQISKNIDFQILVFICALFGLLISIILWALDLTKYSAFTGFITCAFTCLGFLPMSSKKPRD